MKRLHLPLFALGISALFLFLNSCYSKTAMPVPLEMQGNWQGQAKVIVAWCEQDQLDVKVSILPEGQVFGNVGDARLKNASIALNRGALGRWLGIATDYIIVAELEGAIVAKENIVRNSVSIPVNFEEGEFVGGLHSSGMQVGDKTNMILTAKDLVLRAVAN